MATNLNTTEAFIGKLLAPLTGAEALSIERENDEERGRVERVTASILNEAQKRGFVSMGVHDPREKQLERLAVARDAMERAEENGDERVVINIMMTAINQYAREIKAADAIRYEHGFLDYLA